MATKAPAEPLLVVLGSTGTGKSQLAIELATRFRGEIINSDAMQLYNGLPVITNKVTTDEQRGVPHHLLGNISLNEMPWDVEDYKREATKVIREIRSRGNLPILVGGTQYYVDPLLFRDVILDDVQSDPSKSFPILESPTEVLLEELKKVDPVMAERWHPNDRRKIMRSLEIYLSTGKPASMFYAEQRERKAAAARESGGSEPWEKLLFWVYSEREVLKERLDTRVGDMLSAGLLQEVRELFDFKRKTTSSGIALDMTKGIWQAIGYKQFEPVLDATSRGKEATEIERLKATALEDMKVATRRYANYQTRWIRLKQIPRIREQGPDALGHLYVLDSTDVAQYATNVTEPAVKLTAQFLAGETRPVPEDVSALAREVIQQASEPPDKDVFRKRTCELCQMVVVTEQAWQKHVKGSNHKRAMKRKKKLALVPVERKPDGEQERAGVKCDEGDNSSDPEIGSIFSI